MKRCVKCQEEKPVTEFYKSQKWIQGRCKACMQWAKPRDYRPVDLHKMADFYRPENQR